MSDAPKFPYGDETLEQGFNLLGQVCAHPSIDSLRTLTEREVGLLTWTVFTQFGYGVEAMVHHAASFDFILHSHPAAEVQSTIFIETKHYTNTMVATSSIEELIAIVGDRDGAQGYFVTTGEFSRAAYLCAQSEPKIVLLNGERLLRLVCIAALAPMGGLAQHDPVRRLRLAEAITKVLPTQVHIVTIASFKGGTGKTTSTIQLARCFASFGYSVLVVDMDMHRTASLSLAQGTIAPTQPESEAFDYYSPIMASTYPGVDWMQVSQSAAFLPVWADLAMVRELHEVVLPHQHYDWVFIDTAPSLGVATTRAALAASHYVVTTVGPWHSDISGFNQLREAIFMERAIIGEGVILLGAILTRYSDRGAEKALFAELQQQLEQHQVNVLGMVAEDDYHDEQLLHAAYHHIAQRIISLTR